MSDTGVEIQKPRLPEGLEFSPNLVFFGREGPPGENGTRVIHFPDYFGPGSNIAQRFLSSYEEIERVVGGLKQTHRRIVYTAGVWDLIHRGHARYFEEARRRGDILIVGVETDEAVRMRKGPRRPVVGFEERVEMACHIRHVDLVVPVLDYNPTTGLSGLKMHQIIQPDVLVVSERYFAEDPSTTDWLAKVKPYCNQIDILASQAENSSSNRIRDFVIHYFDLFQGVLKKGKKKIIEDLDGIFEELINESQEALDNQ